jgi:hypothetical protein
MMLTQPNQIEMFRLLTIIKAMELEQNTGMKLTRISPWSVAKNSYGIKGTRAKVLEKFKAYAKAKHLDFGFPPEDWKH